MSTTKTSTPSHGDRLDCIGMDMIPPYGVYVDGVEVATYESKELAEAHYAELRDS